MRRTVWKPSEMAESGYHEAGHCGASSRSYSSPWHHEGYHRGQRRCARRMVEMTRVYGRDSSRDTPSTSPGSPGRTENALWFAILDLWTRSHSQSGLRERSASPRFPSKNWPLSRASLQLTTLKLCSARGCQKTNRRRTSPPACASGVEKVTAPPTRNERRHRDTDVVSMLFKGDTRAVATSPPSQVDCSESPS